MKWIGLPVLIILLLAACSSDPPVVEQIQWYLEAAYETDETSPRHYLHLEVQVHEPQGPKDLVSLVITGPRDLVWTLDPAELVVSSQGEDVVLAVGRLAPIGGMDFPAGSYHLQTADIPGNIGEGEFFLPESSSRLIGTIPDKEGSVYIVEETGCRYLIWEDPDRRVIYSRGPVCP